MSLLSARDFTLVMLAIVFVAGAASIALLAPLPSAMNAWTAGALFVAALLMLFLALFPNCFRWPGQGQEELPRQSSKPAGRPSL